MPCALYDVRRADDGEQTPDLATVSGIILRRRGVTGIASTIVDLAVPCPGRGRDAELKAKIAAPVREAGRQSQDKYGHLAAPRALASGGHLFDLLERVPVFVAACMHGRPHGGNAELSAFYGSVYPALWSLQLALRSRGLGSTIVGYHLADREQDVAQILGMHTPHVVGGSGGVVLLLNPA